jgi:SulP family sulfate permease
MITADALRESDLFRDLPPADVEKLATMAKEETFQKDAFVFHEKDPAAKVYVVLTGMIEIARESKGDHRPIRLLRLGRGEVFGELSLLDDAGGRSASAMATLTPETRVAAWSIAELNGLFEKDPALAARLHRSIARKLATRLRATSEAVFALLQGVLGKHL